MSRAKIRKPANKLNQPVNTDLVITEYRELMVLVAEYDLILDSLSDRRGAIVEKLKKVEYELTSAGVFPKVDNEESVPSIPSVREMAKLRLLS